MYTEEKENPKTTTVGEEDLCGSTNPETGSTNAAANAEPETVTTPSSGSTGESITAFVEQSLTAVTPDHTNQDTEAQETSAELPSSFGGTVEKVSVSVPLTFVTASKSGRTDKKASQDLVPGGKKATLQELLRTDTSDVDELYDSFGVAADAEQARATTFGTSSFPAFVRDLHSEAGHSDVEQAQYRKALASTPRELSATGRATIRKNVSANKPIDLLIGHETIAFNEAQMHQVLRTIAYESVISSFYLMK